MKTHTEKSTFYAVEMIGPQDTEPTLVIGDNGVPAFFTARRRAKRFAGNLGIAYAFRVVPVEVTFRWEGKP